MGTFLGIVALLITLVAFIPLLGFLNWVAIPISVIFLIICAILKSDNGKTLCMCTLSFWVYCALCLVEGYSNLLRDNENCLQIKGR